MYYANEIRQVGEYGRTDHVELKEPEKKLARQLIESLEAPFDAKKYHDEYQERLKALIEAKLQGKEVAVTPHPQLAPVIDLMEALKKSIADRQAAPKKPPTRAVAAVPEVPVAQSKKAGKKSVG